MTFPTATIYLPYHALDEVHLRGTRASQPAASAVVAGTLYSVTDEGDALERSDGTTWAAYAPSGGGGAPAAHHTSHEPGGSDVIVDAAWTDRENTFAGDQFIDGDLFVTGEVNPVRRAVQIAKIDQFTGTPVGDPSGSRTLMSRSLVSGLSIRHDEALGHGRLSVGDYDTQLYQPLLFEVETFQVHTGVSPGDREEHLRVHPTGGVTVGADPDHDLDPGVGMVQARGLGTTPLSASNLTSGTLPDARLSANVARRDQVNTFTEKQELRVPEGDAAARLTWHEQTAPVNQRKWQLQAYAQDLNVVALDDAETTALTSFTFSRLGNFRANMGILERSRAYAMGEWQSVPFNASDYFPNAGTWTVAAGHVVDSTYTLIGQTLIWSIYLNNTTVSGSPTALQVRLPNGMTHGSSRGTAFLYGGSGASGTGMAQTYYTLPTQLNLYRDVTGATAYPDGVYHVVVTVTVAIN